MISINDILADQTDAQRTKTLCIYLKAIATLHRSGKKASILIDPSRSHPSLWSITPVGGSLYPMDNLTDCLAQLHPHYDRYLTSAFHSYNKAAANKAQLKHVERNVYKKRKAINKKLESCFKTNDRSRSEKSWNRFQVVNRKYDSSSLQQILNNPDQAIDQGELIKDCAATTVCLYTMADNKKVIIKRYNSKGTIYSLMRSFISSRARVCWRGALLLEQIGINTPENLAMMECRSGHWIKSSYLVTEFIDGETFIDIFTEESDKSQWEKIAPQVEDMFLSFLPLKISHGDCKSLNFLVKNSVVFVIDLDSMKSYRSKWLFKNALQKDITRFERNWVDIPSAKRLYEPVISSIRSFL